MGMHIEQQRIMEANLDKARSDNGDLKRTIVTLTERLNHQEQCLNFQAKENEDLKHDNTLLYQKSV